MMGILGISTVVAWALALLSAASWDGAQLERPRVWAELPHLQALMHDRPYGPAGSEYLQGGPGRRYPVLGRSIDGEWIALRPDRLENRWNQQYGWLPRDSVRLNVDAASLPIVASSDLEVISVDADGVFGRQYAVVEGAPDVRWRGDNALVGAGDGLWEWRPFAETPRVIDDRRWDQLSPDGRWVLGDDGVFGNPDVSDLRIMSTDGHEEVSFSALDFHCVFRLAECSYWSPNSEYLRIWSAGRPAEDANFIHVLGIDGSHTEPPIGERVRWLTDSTLLVGDETAMRVLSPAGAVEREVDTSTLDVDCGISSKSSSLWAGPARDPNQPWHLVDLATGEIVALAEPLDRSPEGDQCEGTGQWRPISFAGRFILLYRAVDAASQDSQLMFYDIDAHRGIPLAEGLAPHIGQRPQVLWSPELDRVVVSAWNTPVVIVEIESLSVRAFSDPPIGGEPIAWAPDGRRLLMRRFVLTSEYDDQGISAFPEGPTRGRVSEFLPSDWHYREYVILDASTGDIVFRVRADGDVCRAGRHTATWSPDGRWLAFVGVQLPSICFLSSTFGE